MKLSASILALALSSFSIAQAMEPSLSMVPEVPMSNPPPPDDDDNEDRYIVKYVSGRRRAATRRLQEAGEIVMSLPKDDAEVVILHSQDEVKKLEASPDVVRVEKDHKVYMMQTNYEPTLWGLTMVQAQDVDASNVSNRKVCVIDTGYDLNHPDLQQTNVNGYNGSFGSNAGPWYEDGNGHGTHVAGTIAALGNGVGVVGVVPTGTMGLHIVRVFGDDGRWAWSSSLVAAVEACAEAGSDVVNMSLGGGGSSIFEAEAYERIYREDDVLLVAAAGNFGNSQYSYPASYTSVMSVGAVDSSKNHVSFSQFNNQVDISAPGKDILSTFPNNAYAYMSGTSMATPHVAGVAALVWSHFPGLKAQQIRKAIEQTAEDRGSQGYDNYYGHGISRAKAAFDDLQSGNIPSVCTDTVAGWVDGNSRDCSYYSIGNNCAFFGNNQGSGGFKANEACCSCGGGSTSDDTPPPAPSPVVQPSDPPVSRPPSTAPVRNPTRPPVSNPPSTAPVRNPTMPPVTSPTVDNTCRDSATKFTYRNSANGKNCLFINGKPTKRCQFNDVNDECPVTCGADCTPTDNPDTFRFKGNVRDCAWVERRRANRCRNNKLRSNCPETCNKITYNF